MDIRRDVWQWLLDAGTVAPSRAREASSGKIWVDQKTVDQMDSGVAMARALEAMDERHIKQLSKIKNIDGYDDDNKLTHWKILAKVLFKYSIKITDGVLGLIMNGDFELVLDIYYDLFARISARKIKIGPTSIQHSGRAAVSRREVDAELLTDDELLQVPTGEHDLKGSLLTRMQNFDKASMRGDDSIKRIDLRRCKTCDELLALSMMQQLGLPGSTVAGMVMLGPAHLKFESKVVNGMKDEDGQISHKPAGRWIGTLHNCIDTFTASLVRGLRERSRDVGMAWGARVLGTLQPCLISHSADVASLAVDLLIKLGSALLISGSGDVGYRWLILEGGITRGGLPYMVACAHTHPDLRRAVGVAMDLLSRGRLLRIFTHHLTAIVPNKIAFLAFAQDLVAALSKFEPSRDAVLESGLIEFLVGQGLMTCSRESGVDLRQTALTLLTEMWRMFPKAVMQGRAGQAEQIVDALKRGARDPSLRLQISSVANLFHLLDVTVNDPHNSRNPHAPRVYKTIIFLFIENHSNESVREFIVTNLVTALEPYEGEIDQNGVLQRDPNVPDSVSKSKMKEIPVGVLVDPAVKQASTHGYNNHDFELFGVIARHTRLTIDQAMPLADLLGKISLNDPLFGRCAAGPLETILRRFGDKSRAHEFVQRFSKVALATFMHVETKHGGQMRQLRDKQRADIADAKSRGDNEDNASKLIFDKKNGDYDVLMIRQALIVSMLQLIVKIDNQIYNLRTRPLIEMVNEQFAHLNDGRRSKGLTALLNFMDTGHVLGEQLGDADVYEFASEDDNSDDYRDEEDYGAPETRRKRNESDSTREMMRQAQQGKILVFSDDEDEDSNGIYRDRDDESEDDNYYQRVGAYQDAGNASDSDDDNYVATAPGGKRQFKRGAELPSVNTSDLINGLGNDSEIPQQRQQKQKPRRPGGGKHRPQPSPRTKRVRKSKQKGHKVISAKNNADHKRLEYERGSTKAARDKKQSEWMVGKRKVHMKIKKAPKTVQGDIDAHKMKHEQRLRDEHRVKMEKQHREQQVRRRMRQQFDRKLAAKQMYRRRQQQKKARGVKVIRLFGRIDRGDRHAGNFYERQDAMLQMHLNAEGETQKAIDSAREWIDESLALFKKWLRPLKYIFTIYTSEFVNAFSPAFDFQALMERSGGLALGEYMKFCRDFKLVPMILNRTESLALYHYANAEDGNRTARHNEPLLGFEELVSCLHGVAMSSAFNSLPDVQDRVDALCAFMRRQAITQGLSGPEGSINKVLHRRLGNKRQWEDGRCPMVEYRWIVPRSLGMPTSLVVSLEIVDECVAAAANVHVLDLVKMDWEETEEPEEDAWEPPSTVPLVNDRLYPADTIAKNRADIHPAAGSHVYGFGGGFVPPPKPKRIKRQKYGKFGERTIGRLPLRFVPAARYMISILRELADDCTNGKARKRLMMRYSISGKGWEAVTEAPLRQGIGADAGFVKMGPRKIQVPPEPKFQSPKRKEKAAMRRLRAAHRDEEINELKERKRQARALELEEILETQKRKHAEREAKKKEDKERIKALEKSREAHRRKEAAELARRQREQIEEWKANGGRRGGGKKGVYKNYMSTDSRDSSQYADEKRKKMVAFKKKKAAEKAKLEAEAAAKRKKKQMAEESRQRSVQAQRKKQQAAEAKAKDDAELRKSIEAQRDGNDSDSQGRGGEEEDDTEAQTKAALKIEAAVRGKRDRGKVKKMKEQRKKEIEAANKIEARVRGNRDRARVQKMKEDKKRKEGEEKEGTGVLGEVSDDEDTPPTMPARDTAENAAPAPEDAAPAPPPREAKESPEAEESESSLNSDEEYVTATESDEGEAAV